MAEDVSSMEVEGVWRDFGLVAGIVRVKDELKEAALGAKNFASEVVRAEATAKALKIALGAISLGGLTALILQGPRISGELSRMQTYLELIGLELDDNVSPAATAAADAIEDLYHWFKDLPEPIQSAMLWIGIFLGSIAGISTAIKVLGLTGLVTKLGGVSGALSAVSSAAVMLTAVLLGLFLGIQGVKVLDDLGVLDWFADLGERFRTSEGFASTFYDTMVLLLAPIAMFGDFILALAGLKEWDILDDDMQRIADSAGRLLSKLEKLDPYFEKFGFGGVGSSSLAMGTGPAAAKNQTVSVTNNFGDVNLSGGLDMDSFLSEVNKSQAENVKWEEMS